MSISGSSSSKLTTSSSFRQVHKNISQEKPKKLKLQAIKNNRLHFVNSHPRAANAAEAGDIDSDV
jgi:hypothetical protein